MLFWLLIKQELYFIVVADQVDKWMIITFRETDIKCIQCVYRNLIGKIIQNQKPNKINLFIVQIILRMYVLIQS